MTANWGRELSATSHARGGARPPARSSVPAGGSPVVGRFLDTVIVTLHGELDAAAAVDLARILGDLVDGDGNGEGDLGVVVDLRELSGIDGSGVDVLAAAAASMATRGGALRLGGPVGAVVDPRARAGLTRLLNLPVEEANRPRL